MEEEKKHPLLKILLLDIGVAGTGIFGALGIILISFILLNYFNILSLSELYPQLLSSLPRKDVPNVTSQTQPPKFSPYVFSYDTKKAERLLTSFITDNIKPSFLPEKIEIKQGLSIDGRMEDLKYEYGVRFTINKDLFSSNFHYIEKTNTQNDFLIFVQPENVTSATATASLANSLLAFYFINPFQNISNCKSTGITSYCETFQTESNGKRGFGVAIVNQGGKITPVVFTCFVPKESKVYSTQTSCIRPQ